MDFVRDIDIDRESGFSLVEILAGVVLMGILVAISVGVYLKQREKGNDEKVVALTQDIVSTIEEAKTWKTPEKVFSAKIGSSDFNSAPRNMDINFSDVSGKIGSVKVPGGLYAKVDPFGGKEYKVTVYMAKNSKYTSSKPFIYDSTKNSLASIQ